MNDWVRVAELAVVILLAITNVASAKTASYVPEVDEIINLLQWWDQYGSAWDALDNELAMQQTLFNVAIGQVQASHLTETIP